MKQIYKIGTRQHFTYKIPAFLKKNVKVEKHWVVRNVKYIFASSEEEAKEKYTNYFFKKYTKITHGYGNWYLTSDGNVDIWMEEDFIDITSTEIVAIDTRICANYEELKENMLAEDFKEWWFDNGRCSQIPK